MAINRDQGLRLTCQIGHRARAGAIVTGAAAVWQSWCAAACAAGNAVQAADKMDEVT